MTLAILAHGSSLAKAQKTTIYVLQYTIPSSRVECAQNKASIIRLNARGY